jgi:hypothetical protein
VAPKGLKTHAQFHPPLSFLKFRSFDSTRRANQCS